MTVRAYKLGALGQDDLTGVVILTAQCIANAADNYMTFEYPVGTDYQVPAGNTLYITKIDVSGYGAVPEGATSCIIGYGDDGVADGSSAPTNWKRLTGRYSRQSAVSTVTFDVIIPIPASKYPCLGTPEHAVQVSVTVYGIVVPD